MNAAPSNPPRRFTGPLIIAFADDVSEIQVLGREWLTTAGHLVTCVSDGLQLLQVLRERHFDVVITDVMMPESDGLEAITEMKKTRPEVKIIAISGGGFSMTASDCLRVALRLGADAALQKPFTREQLLEAVDAVVATMGERA